MNIEERIKAIVIRIWDDGSGDALGNGTIGNDVDYTDEIKELFSGWLSPEQVRERERKLLKKIEQAFMWGQVPHLTSSGNMQKWTMRCISDADWQALKEETEKD